VSNIHFATGDIQKSFRVNVRVFRVIVDAISRRPELLFVAAAHYLSSDESLALQSRVPVWLWTCTATSRSPYSRGSQVQLGNTRHISFLYLPLNSWCYIQKKLQFVYRISYIVIQWEVSRSRPRSGQFSIPQARARCSGLGRHEKQFLH
jgi:hypothetical protein